MTKIYVATSNLSKLKNFQLFFNKIDKSIKVEMVPDLMEVDEIGKTLEDNSKLKILPYVGKYDCPVFSNDSGLFFDEKVIEIQDPVKVKRNALGNKSESDLTRDEIGELMLIFYRKLAKAYGGQIDCWMIDVFTVLTPDGRILQKRTRRDYLLANRNVDQYDHNFPLNALRKSKINNKFMNDFSEQEQLDDASVLVDAIKQLMDEAIGL